MKTAANVQRARFLFFLLLIFTMLPPLLFPICSAFYHQIHRLPQLEDGLLLLEKPHPQYTDFIPLDGSWEVYADRWIVAEGNRPAQPDREVPVPILWLRPAGAFGESLSIASFRMLVQADRKTAHLVLFIPHINARYRAYINGELVSAQGDMDISSWKAPHPVPILGAQLLQGITLEAGETAELVIEIASPHIKGLYKTPLLATWEYAHGNSDMRSMLAAALLGIVLLILCTITSLLLLGSKLFFSRELLLIDCMIALRILLQNNYFFFIKADLLTYEHLINSFLQAITLVLPVVFLLFARQLIEISLSKKTLRFILLYELTLLPIVLLLSLLGMAKISFFFSIFCYLPFVQVLRLVYQSLKRGAAYALSVSAILMLVISSMIVSAMASTGLLLMDVSLYAPTCIVLSMMLQFWVFMRCSIASQQQAMEAENLRLRLKQSESDLMLSQIKPHFLYNTLLAIHVLCTEAPDTAAEATLKFATFLRTNMNFIGSKELIPFQKELQHIQNYVEIEELRRQGRLRVQYEIAVTDFWVPPLSIQPLVENAIRHGACKNVRGGTVVLRTSEDATQYLVEISDDGPGFDPAILSQPQDEPHGLQNICFRLENQQNAQVEIQSSPHTGTLVRVRLPKEVPHEDHSAG